MDIKLIKSTVGDNRNLKAGAVETVTDKTGRFLIALGFAEEHTEASAEQPTKSRKPRKSPVNRMAEPDESRDSGL